MSDIEEPPSKMSKYTDLQYLDECEDALDEGQEEWLSEGVLTDDDYNPASENLQAEVNEDTASQDTADDNGDHVHDTEDSPTNKEELVDSNEDLNITKHNIEDQLNSLDAVKSENGVADDLNAFLIRKSDGQVLDISVDAKEDTKLDAKEDTKLDAKEDTKLDAKEDTKLDAKIDDKVEVNVKEDPVAHIKQDLIKDDGNDTDDLLRMLGDDNGRKKKTLKMVKCEKVEEDSSDDDDDEFIFERSKMRSLRVAKQALQKKPAAKAEPEDMSDDTGASSDEAGTVKRMFGVSRGAGAGARRQVARHVVQLNSHAPKTVHSVQKPIKQYTNRNVQQPKSILKSATPVSMLKASHKPTILKSVENKAPTSKSGEIKTMNSKSGEIKKMTSKSGEIKTMTSKSGEIKLMTLKSNEIKMPISKSVEIKTPSLFKPLETSTMKSEPGVKFEGKNRTFKAEEMDDIIDEEFLDDDGLDVDELCSESESEEEEREHAEGEREGEGSGRRLRMRRPERMDEDALSDADSHTEDGSLYDELPSSDSDDMDDWFSLDIRAERAGDYLPLLGCKARGLLTAERGRVESRVATLRQSLAALTASARRQADQLRAAAMALAEIDDTLRAA